MPFWIPDPRWEEPNLLIPGKKPVGPVDFTERHLFSDLFKGYLSDGVSGKAGTLVATGGASVTAPDGLRIRGGTHNTRGGYAHYDLGGAFLNTSGYTVIVDVQFRSNQPTTAGGDVILEKPYTSAAEPYYAFQLKRSRSDVCGMSIQYTLGGTRYFLNVGPTGAHLNNNRVQAVIGMRDGEQYIVYLANGFIQEATAAETGSPSDYNTDLYVGASGVLPALGAMDKDILYAGIIHRFIPFAVAKTILRNPYQFLIPA